MSNNNNRLEGYRIIHKSSVEAYERVVNEYIREGFEFMNGEGVKIMENDVGEMYYTAQMVKYHETTDTHDTHDTGVGSIRLTELANMTFPTTGNDSPIDTQEEQMRLYEQSLNQGQETQGKKRKKN